ncbi:MAG: T9SS type A sorting domain-containing protein [Ignavibacteriae bacterium]|nr:T9SS type A sorting domain-containing protein [Ignavibacteriota bacterium]
MKKVIRCLLIIIAYASFTGSVCSQVNNQYKWMTPGPQGNTISWIKRWDANNWYATGDGATFMKTSNGGANWTIYNNLLNDDYNNTGFIFGAEFFDMNTGVACGLYGKLLRTTNGGESWSFTQVPQDTTTWWTHLYFLDQNTGFVCGSSKWIGKTTDGGITWTGLFINNQYDISTICAKDENNILAGYSNGGMKKTTNGGVNWTTVSTGTVAYFVDMEIAGGDTVYATGNEVLMSTNFGTDWTVVSDSLQYSNYDVDIVNISGTKYVYLTGQDTVLYRAPVGSTSWEPVSFLGDSQLQLGDVEFYASDFSITGDTIITVGSSGVMNLRNSATNKTFLTSYIKGPWWNQNDLWAESTNGRVICVGSQTYINPPGDHNQIIYSTNGGQSWQTSVFPAVDDAISSISMVNSMTGYVGSSDGTVFKTTNGGVSWEATTSQPSTIRGTYIGETFFADANTGYVFSDINSKTTNGGVNWSTYAPGVSLEYINGAHFINGNTGWTVGDNGEVYKTTNGGATVTQQDPQMPDDIDEIFMLNANTGWIVGDNGVVRKTTNGGNNWDTADVPFDASLNRVHFIDQFNGIVIAGYGGGAYRTRDGGLTWEANNTTVYNEALWMTAPDRAFIGGSGGEILQYRETVTGTELTFTNEVPSEYHLEQNYPNPFNPSTTIKFGLPRAGLVSLKVYDIAGREVAALINNQRMNAGQVTQRFNGSGLASGVYFYSLVIDGEMIATKKMLLIK